MRAVDVRGTFNAGAFPRSRPEYRIQATHFVTINLQNIITIYPELHLTPGRLL